VVNFNQAFNMSRLVSSHWD